MTIFATPLRDRVAVVTGASRGIGQAIAHQLALAGAAVIGTATTETGAAQITSRLAEAGLSGRGLVLDVTQPEAAAGLVDQVLRDHGRLDILVNNAGITRDNLALRMKDAEWEEVIQANLTGVFRLSRAVLKPMMKARWGRIINITSVVGLSGNPGQMNYAAAKAGVAGMSRALAREIASRGVTVNCVAPGFIETDMTRALSAEQMTALQQQIPAQRLGTVDDVAASVVFLSTEAAGYITGETLSVNGGMVMC